MATAQQLASQNQGPAEQKIVKEYMPVQKLIEDLFIEVNEAELQQIRYAHYLTRIYDELSVIARGKCSADTLKGLLHEWGRLEHEHGALDGKKGRLPISEWRERKRALSAMREDLGMGTSKPLGGKHLSPPLRISAFNDCPLDCPVLVKAQEKRRRWA